MFKLKSKNFDRHGNLTDFVNNNCGVDNIVMITYSDPTGYVLFYREKI